MQTNIINWCRNNIALLALLLATFIVYVPTLSADFVIDDTPFIKDNPYIHHFSDITRYFTRGVWENSAHEISNEPLYRPMNLMPMMINHAIWGNNPFGYHLFLVLLHLANTCLLYALIRRIAAATPSAAAIGSAIFALHPAKVESVAWISGGIDPLAAFFLLAAMYAHRVYIEQMDMQAANQAGRKHWQYAALSLVCFQLALWSKEVSFIFPLIVAVHDLIYRKRIHWPIIMMQGIIVGVYLIMRSIVLSKAGQVSALDLSQLSRAVDFMLGYGEMLVLPLHMPFYIKPPGHPVSSSLGMVSVLFTAVLAAFGWRVVMPEKRKDLLFSVVWAIGFFWPAVLLAFYTDGFFAGRYLYVSSAGVALFASLLFQHADLKWPRLKPVIMAVFLLPVCLYGWKTWKEIPVWHDDGTIYKKIADVSPENPTGFIGLGQYYINREDYPTAEQNYLIALQKAVMPQARVEILVALGTINGISSHLDRSETYFREAVGIDPENPDAWAGLGNLAWMKGRSDEAITCYEKALAVRPDYYEAAMNLAAVYDKSGQSQRADLMRQRASVMRH